MQTVITTRNGISREEALCYVDYIEKKYGQKVLWLTATGDDEYVDLEFKLQSVPFERVRRITGYLVGDMSKWNDAKKAEEKDRVKHGLKSKMEVLLP